MIMKGCLQWNPVYGREDFEAPETARSVGQYYLGHFGNFNEAGVQLFFFLVLSFCGWSATSLNACSPLQFKSSV